MNFRQRMQWILRMALLVFVLSSVGFLSALTAMRFEIQGREVAMPDLVGKPASQGRQILRGRRLSLKIKDRYTAIFPLTQWFAKARRLT